MGTLDFPMPPTLFELLRDFSRSEAELERALKPAAQAVHQNMVALASAIQPIVDSINSLFFSTKLIESIKPLADVLGAFVESDVGNAMVRVKTDWSAVNPSLVIGAEPDDPSFN